ncbi:UDP-forming cellulose synthase catalytic subunit [Vulgatibacter sp.]|uniref:UDP-forming cellulose synthase catalytic subunit n=1 Tax=Vulgatibacter sp. TaxID=1971226 RepID=UPI003568C099
MRASIGGVVRPVAAFLGLAMLALVVVTPLEIRDQAVLGAVIFAFALILNRFAGRLATLALIVISVAASTRYLYWRLTMTVAAELSADVVFGGLLLLAELYAFTMLLLGYFQSLHPLERKPVPLPEDTRRWPSVDVFIPTYNEPLAVVRATVLAAKALDWPADKLNIYLLDDGRRDAFRAFAAQAGVGYLIRPDNKHAKAGNLNAALGRTRGEFIAIFDCDHVPTRSFLQTTMGWFLRDKKLGMLQTPHHFYSPDPFERNLRTFRNVPNEGELFYGLIQPTNDLWNAAFFCGSCAVLRRSALEDVGGVAVETVTEDAHTALKMHRKGYNTAYLSLPQAAGLATESLSAHVGQRIRWARGMAQIFRVDNPLLGRGLSLPQRLCYLGAMLHFLYGIPRLIFLTAPLGYLVFDLHIFNAIPLAVLAHWAPHMAHALVTNSRTQGGFRHSFWSEIYETCLAAYITIPTTIALLNPKAGTFNVTAKGAGQVDSIFFDRRIAMPYLALCGLNLVALGFGVWRLATGQGAFGVLGVNLGWTAYNLLILAATAAVAWETRQVRQKHRIPVKLPAMLRLEDGRTLRCTTSDLSLGGASLSLGGDRTFHRGDALHLSIFTGGDELPLPVQVVRHDGGALRVRFPHLTVDEESHLVQALFSRADAWLGWRKQEQRDRPVAAFLQITGKALAGSFRLLRHRRAAPQPGAPGGAA